MQKYIKLKNPIDYEWTMSSATKAGLSWEVFFMLWNNTLAGFS